MEEVLEMRFEPNTIEHLGVKMYSHVPPALAELIANAYDACAENVTIDLYDDNEFKIIVEDDGSGMTFSEVNDRFLRIGRNRRNEQQEVPCNRVPTGKKGLGKLALFGIGNKITIITCKNFEKTTFTLDWNEILKTSGSYKPDSIVEKLDTKESGTKIILEDLNRKSGFPIDDYAVNISKLFNFQDKKFDLIIRLNEGEYIAIDNKLKYKNITPQFEWSFQEAVSQMEIDYKKKNEITGSLLTTEKPLKPGLRGITLFANGRMVNSAEFFGRAESSYFFSYLTGWLQVDFIDNIDKDIIATDRQSINWETEMTRELRLFLSDFLRELEEIWRAKRKDFSRKKIMEKTSININNWMKTIPVELKAKLEPILTQIDNSQMSPDNQSETIENLHFLIPEYPNLHWRHLHPEIQDAAESDYKSEDYYRAFIEAVKRYINRVRSKSGSDNSSDNGMMGEVFGLAKRLQVAQSFLKPDGSNFHQDTYKCIEEGQKFLSMGIVTGARNPISHEEIFDLKESALFTEKDCLDLLSLLSHLFKRLEEAEVV